MTKLELLQYLEDKDFVEKVMSPNLKEEKTEDGAKWYSVPFLEMNDTIGIYRTHDIYVIDEGLADEKAVFKDREPVATIKTENALLTQYASAIETLKGEVEEANDNYIIIKAVDRTTKEIVRWFADSDEYFKLSE